MRDLRRLAVAPHRLFFFSGIVQLLLASAWWLATLALRSQGVSAPLAAGLDAPRVHAFLMIYGFFPFFIFGFLFTAGPRWLSLPSPAARTYVPPGLAAASSAVLLQVGAQLGPAIFALACMVYLFAWLAILLRFVGMIRSSPEEDRTHAIHAALALGGGALGVACMAIYAATAWQPAARAMEVLGLWAFLVPVFCTVCHRMIPFFTGSVLPFVAPWRPQWTLMLLVYGSVAHGALALGPLEGGPGSSTCPWRWRAQRLPCAGVSLKASSIACSRCCTWASRGWAWPMACWARSRCCAWRASNRSGWRRCMRSRSASSPRPRSAW